MELVERSIFSVSVIVNFPLLPPLMPQKWRAAKSTIGKMLSVNWIFKRPVLASFSSHFWFGAEKYQNIKTVRCYFLELCLVAFDSLVIILHP